MSSLETITSENLERYSGLIDPEEGDNLGRIYYRTLGVLSDEGKPAGAAIWQLKYLENDEKKTLSFLKSVFFCKEGEKLLFSAYRKMCLSEKASATSFELPIDEEHKYEDAFRQQGFSVKKSEGSDLCVRVAELKGLNLMKKKKTPDYIKDLTGLDEKSFKRGMLNCIFHGVREVTEDLNRLPLDWFERSVSCCSESDGRIEGFLLVRRHSTGRLRIELLIDVGAEPDMDLLNMIRFSIERAGENYPDETEVIIPRYDAVARKLTSFIFPRHKGREVLKGARREDL